jgi:hypothetical protein
MPITSNSTPLESSVTVKNPLITELPLLDTPKMLGLLRILGEPLGEKKDISESREETPVD